MVVDKHLKDLALANRRVIIPDLGAFLSKEGDGDEKSLIFSSFLKYNDGFLEKQLAEKEGIPQSQASEEIKKFVEEVAKALHAKQNYVIDNFGFFHMDERGSITFSPQGTEAIAKPVVIPPIVATASAEEVAATLKTEAAKDESSSQQVEEPKVEHVGITPPLAEQPTTAAQPSNPAPAKPTPKPPQKPAKKHGNNGLLITIIILLVIIIILLMLYFMVPSIKEKVNSMFGIKGAVTTEQPLTPPSQPRPNAADTSATVDSTQTQQVITSEPANSNDASTPKAAATYGSNYYVIVGTFQEKSNADKLYKRCIADGYDAELLPKMGPLYPVSVYSSPSKAECTKVMREAQRKYGDAWLFKSRRH